MKKNVSRETRFIITLYLTKENEIAICYLDNTTT